MLPRPPFLASSPTHTASVLNNHLISFTNDIGQPTRVCEGFDLGELNSVLRILIGEAGEGDGVAQKMRQIYATFPKDGRNLRLADIEEYEAEWMAEASSIANSEDSELLTHLARSGKCYEAAMLYAHHVSSDVKPSLTSRLTLPLLPAPEYAALISTVAEAAANTPPSTAGHDVRKTVSEQLVCAKCHVAPSAPSFESTQTRYVSASGHSLLAQPSSRRSEGGSLVTTLKVTTGRLRGPQSFTTRTYEGGIPGPTLRVRPGDRMEITVDNQLGLPDECLNDENWHFNFFRCPNTTNLHIHGLFVAPYDVFSGVGPSQQKTYTFDLPADHAPGTYYYHPHFHGSVSVQMAGGMSGAVVVEDPEGSLPPALEAMRADEVVMVLQSVEVFNYTQNDFTCPMTGNRSRCHDVDGSGSMLTLRETAGDLLPWDLEVIDDIAGGPVGGDYFIVNGMFQPKLSLRPGQWQRWRLVNAAHQASLSLALPGCDMRVLAMDGVYLRTPRVKTSEKPLILAPSSRADVAVHCSSEGTRQFVSFENPDTYNMGVATGFFSGVVALVDVRGEKLDMAAPTRLPSLPAYLSNSEGTPVQAAPSHTLEWSLVDVINNTAGLTDVPIYGVSDRPFSMTNRLCVPANSVQRWRVVNPLWLCSAGISKCLHTMDRDSIPEEYRAPISLSHGFHLHTYKFQVVGNSQNGDSFDYEIGDWRDTVMTTTAGYIDIQFRTSRFTGVVPYHCHMIPHADRGMIALMEVQDGCDGGGSGVLA